MIRRSKMLLTCTALFGIAVGGLAVIGLSAGAQAQDDGGRRRGADIAEQCSLRCGPMMRDKDRGRWRDRDERGFRHGFHGHRFGPRHGGFVARLFERYDVNDTGRINVQEMLTIRGDDLKKFDSNGDGQLDLTEYQALWLDRMRERMVRSFQRYDRDGDAKVTVEEYNRPIERLAKKLDRNKDGVIERVDRRGPRWGRSDDTRVRNQDQERRNNDTPPADDDANGSTAD
ncbi:hypothetical protein [Rhodoligotrophos defluvii]|uniref:hypothetical protein n=1 Tax=Rhodoligotrophos defluvii TaxID=2561934 RepID=UPI0010C995C6|nr:hypothetical protein [Rhodoligotrophos defluvii]